MPQIAAACPATGAAAGIVMPHHDTPTINLFLEQFSTGLVADVHSVRVDPVLCGLGSVE
ncbi:hypothetical protein TA3x_005611 [Tundrisphaera sp. TA3]|uniref:hypothetical protein n=1 Tax=Tundrisphaera sp. TA3 TaxID=3435775 RepID=UPI003EC0F136